MADTLRLIQAAAAEKPGISTGLLRRYSREGRIARLEGGSYPWPRIKREHDDIKVGKKKNDEAGQGNAGYQAERARLTRARADVAEMEARKLRGELIDREDHKRLLRRRLEQVDTSLKRAPSRDAAWVRHLDRGSEVVDPSNHRDGSRGAPGRGSGEQGGGAVSATLLGSDPVALER